MFDRIRQWFGYRIDPIGVDFGAGALRLAQAPMTESGHRLDAAASYEWNPAERAALEEDDPLEAWQRANFATIIRQLVADGNFTGHSAIVGLPARWTSLIPMQLPPMSRRNFRSAICAAARDKLRYDPADAVMRPLILGARETVAGAMQQALLVAAPRRRVQQMLSILSAAGLRILSVVPESLALVEAYRKVYRRAEEQRRCCAIIDLGADSMRFIVSRAGALQHAARIDTGTCTQGRGRSHFPPLPYTGGRGDGSIGVPLPSRNERGRPLSPEYRQEGEERAVALAAPPRRAASQQVDPLRDAVESFNATADEAIEELIFTGGGARQADVCRSIAAGIGLPHRIGDPLARIGRDSRLPITSGIDRRHPQPHWALAVGLSMGISAQ